MPISERALRMRASTDKQIRERWAREAAAMPNADLATKMFGPLNAPLIPDHKRGAVSPLGGTAQPTKETRR
jgi:hypothetical protein